MGWERIWIIEFTGVGCSSGREPEMKETIEMIWKGRESTGESGHRGRLAARAEFQIRTTWTCNPLNRNRFILSWPRSARCHS
jgi:hypothetical protein